MSASLNYVKISFNKKMQELQEETIWWILFFDIIFITNTNNAKFNALHGIQRISLTATVLGCPEASSTRGLSRIGKETRTPLKVIYNQAHSQNLTIVYFTPTQCWRLELFNLLLWYSLIVQHPLCIRTSHYFTQGNYPRQRKLIGECIPRYRSFFQAHIYV